MFYDILKQETAPEQNQLVRSEIITRCMARNVTLDEYIAYLTQAYHHVKFTVPLLMAAGARLPESREWLRVAVAEYIEEEIGHQEWILNDIAACGGDKEAVRRSQPAMQTELMIAYAWDMVMRQSGRPRGRSDQGGTQSAGASVQLSALPRQHRSVAHPASGKSDEPLHRPGRPGLAAAQHENVLPALQRRVRQRAGDSFQRRRAQRRLRSPRCVSRAG